MEDGYPIAKARLRLIWVKAAIDAKRPLDAGKYQHMEQ